MLVFIFERKHGDELNRPQGRMSVWFHFHRAAAASGKEIQREKRRKETRTDGYKGTNNQRTEESSDGIREDQ